MDVAHDPPIAFRCDAALKQRARSAVLWMRAHVDPYFTLELLGSTALELALAQLEDAHHAGAPFPAGERSTIPSGPRKRPQAVE